ncbi:hypothetical protein LCGC14_2628450, partial [marine sediment metagenome]
MARTLNADLLTAQVSGYPVNGYQPAVRCILTSKNGLTLIVYSFDPTVTTNRLRHVEQTEERQNDSGIILLSNYDKAVPSLIGYQVDLGWGLNTTSGIQWASAVTPRLWVMVQSDISGGPKSAKPQLYTVLQLQGVWQVVLNRQPLRLPSTANTPPDPTIPLYRYDDENTISALTGKTIYGVIEYLIETALSAQTGKVWTLDALGDQDDGQINSTIPFPSGGKPLRTINVDTPFEFQTYGSIIRNLLEETSCILIPRASLAFKIIYPQTSDTADETYYSSASSGHPFYEVENRSLNMVPNHVEIFGGEDLEGQATVSGHWFDPDHYSTAPTTFTPEAIEAAYDGEFMPVTASGSTDNILWEIELDTVSQCETRASQLGRQLKD